MKKIFKKILIVLLIPVAIFFIMAVLLYIPPVQNWIVRQVTSTASEKTGLDISVDNVRLAFPLDLSVNGVCVLQPSDSISGKKDTIVNVRNIIVDIRLLPLFRSQVEIDRLSLSDVNLNTVGLVESARVRGNFGSLELISHGVNLNKETVRLNSVSLADANIDVALNDSVPEDTSESSNFWKICLDKLNISRTSVTVHMPGDTLQLSAYMGNVNVGKGRFDLHEGKYTVGRFRLDNGKITYDNNYEKPVSGLDYNHIALSGLNMSVDSVVYHNTSLSLRMNECAFYEKSGIRMEEISGSVSLDSARINMPDFRLRTSESSVRARADVAFNAFSDKSTGKLNVLLNASLGKQDLSRFMASMPSGFMRRWPNYPLSVKASVTGNMRRASLDGIVIKLPSAFDISCNGRLVDLNDVKKLGADLHLKAKTYNMDFIASLVGSPALRIPKGISVDGKLIARGTKYDVDVTAAEGGGKLNLSAFMNTDGMSYKAKAEAERLDISHFMPSLEFKPFSGSIVMSGKGTDFRSSHTRLNVNAIVSDFVYSVYNLSGITFNAVLDKGKARATLDSHNQLLDGSVALNAAMSHRSMRANLSCDIKNIDFYRLRVFDVPAEMSLKADMDFASNFKKNHSVSGSIRDIALTDSSRVYTPEDVLIDAFTRADSTSAVVRSGDFDMMARASGGYEKIMRSGQKLMAEVARQLKERYIDQARLRENFPHMRFHFCAGRDNFFSRSLKRFGFDMKHAQIDMRSSMSDGINGNIAIDSLVVSGVRLDTIRLVVNSDTLRTDFNGQVRNGPGNPQYVFNTLFRGAFYERGIYLGVRMYDDKERVGVSLGVDAAMADNGIRVRFGSRGTPILGFKPFEINKDNYLFFGDDRRISANLRLRADDGMGIRVFTNDSTEALQDITVGLVKFNLDEVLSVIPYVPKMSGILNGDFHLVSTADEKNISSSVSIENFVYEGNRIGNLSSDFAYMPKEDGSHYVDGFLSCNDEEIATLKGSYNSADDGYLNADLTLSRTPLRIINGFMPDHTFGLRGYAGGDLSIKGALSSPVVNGEVRFDSAYVVSIPYGVRLRFDETPVPITNSNLVFDDYKMYARNNSPLTLTGYFDFADMDNMYLDLGVRATNYQLVNAKENRRSEVYGKAYVNFYAMMRGSLESMQIRGKLDVLGSTDMTYILRDSPLTTDNQLDGLVKFVNLNDSTEDIVTRPPLTGIDMDLTMSIDEGAHIMCALNESHSNYVDLIGGGDLRMQYNAVDNLRLTGRYTLSNGEMKYSLPVIPLKTFVIQDGSYIEFMGDPMNPKLNITATEQTKTNVSTDGDAGRSVLFNCGVVITKTLNDMGLKFIIDAPEDMTIHNQLQTMSEENRGKLAVTMLTTGMYLADGNTSSFSMNSALSAFLNSQINSISGNALRTLDLSFGMDNTTLSSGQVQTDYSFKFSKRFWNNRLNIVIGGKVSTGAEVENQNNTFFDNVTFEYRLSQNSNKYLKLFYERDSYDWLEGYVGKYGGGFMWRRKLQRLTDIFRFKSKDNSDKNMPKDSVTVSKDENNR